jgi:hypothetical protein
MYICDSSRHRKRHSLIRESHFLPLADRLQGGCSPLLRRVPPAAARANGVDCRVGRNYGARRAGLGARCQVATRGRGVPAARDYLNVAPLSPSTWGSWSLQSRTARMVTGVSGNRVAFPHCRAGPHHPGDNTNGRLGADVNLVKIQGGVVPRQYRRNAYNKSGRGFYDLT